MWKIILLALFCSCISGDENIQSLPVNLSWGNIDTDGDGILENYITPIKQQLCADCYLYASIGLLEIQFQIDHKMGSALNLSEQNLRSCLGLSCSMAGNAYIPLDYIQKYGVMEEEYAPNGIWSSCHNCEGQIYTRTSKWLSVDRIPFYTFKQYNDIISENIKYEDKKIILIQALQNGPVVIEIGDWLGFKKIGNTYHCIDKNPSGHLAIIVGYINHGDIFLVKNSHGGGDILSFAFEGGDKCDFANTAQQIKPGSTYISWGLGTKYCYANTDTDKDGITDPYDNCIYDKNPSQENDDLDLFGNVCDPCPSGLNIETLYYCP